jgi:hypothetical protein
VADLDQAVAQCVDGLGVFEQVVVLVVVGRVLADVDGLGAGAGRGGLVTRLRSRLLHLDGWSEQALDGEVDGAVDDGASGSQLSRVVVDPKHRVFSVLRQHGGEGARRPVAPGSVAVCSFSEIRSCCSSASRTAPWVLIFFGVGGGESPSRCARRRRRRS